MPGVNEITALELLRMGFVIAPALVFRGRRHGHLTCEQRLDCLIDGYCVGRLRVEDSECERPLTEQLARGGEFGTHAGSDRDVHAVDRDAHDRTGCLARVCGVRTI